MWNRTGVFGDASVHWKYKQRQKKKRERKSGKIPASLTCSLRGEITWLKVRKELFKWKPLQYLHVLSQLPGARALRGTVSFWRDLFVNPILELKKCFLVTANQLKHVAGRRRGVSPEECQELNGKRVERNFFCQGRHKEQKKGIIIYFLRQQIGVQQMAEGQAVVHFQAMISVILSNFIWYSSNHTIYWAW